MERHNFLKPLHLACANDTTRRYMECVYFKGGYAYATNAHILIKSPLAYHNILDHSDLDGKFLHRTGFEVLYSFQNAVAVKKGVECWNDDGSKCIVLFENIDEKYPDCEDCIQKAMEGTEDVKFPVSIDPSLFYSLSKVMFSTTNNYILNSKVKGLYPGPIVVRSNETNKDLYATQVGLIMPPMILD